MRDPETDHTLGTPTPVLLVATLLHNWRALRDIMRSTRIHRIMDINLGNEREKSTYYGRKL